MRHLFAGTHPDRPSPAAPTTPRESRKRFRIVLVVTVSFLLIETVGGWLTGSLALLADAGHLLGDVGALSLALAAMWLADQPATLSKTYGYQRAEILAALFNGLALWLVAGLIWHEAYVRLSAPPPIQGLGMSLVALAGLAANLVSYLYLSGIGRHTLNPRAAMLHLIGDILGSIGALVAGLTIWATGWLWADPLASLLIGGLILVTSGSVIKEAIDLLMEGTPKEIDVSEVMEALRVIRGLESLHDVHVWSLRSGVPAFTAHGVIGESADDAAILAEMSRLLAERFQITHTTIQLDRRPAFVRIDTGRGGAG